jgi:hypothetical protein
MPLQKKMPKAYDFCGIFLCSQNNFSKNRNESIMVTTRFFKFFSAALLKIFENGQK